MRFAHLADCHIGGWREQKLSEATTKAFSAAIDKCVEKQIDFVLIAGDLFNTSLPSVDRLKEMVLKLKELKDRGIAVYVIAGSHDFSPTGKTMLDVLENAGLIVNAAKNAEEEGKFRLSFVVDGKTGAKIAGMIGKKGGLEKEIYAKLVRENLENESGFKIFMFHSLLSELKTAEFEKTDSVQLTALPKNFNYYAGGHPHFVEKKKLENYGLFAYPGPLFPNNFAELEKLENGGFYVIDVEEGKINAEWQPIVVHNVYSIKLDCDDKSPEGVEEEIIEQIKDKEFNNTIITLRLSGTLKSGKVTDINFKSIFNKLYGKGAFFVMKNTSALKSKEFREIKTSEGQVADVEEELIKQSIEDVKEVEKVKNLMLALDKEKGEGETTAVFEQRVKDDLFRMLEL